MPTFAQLQAWNSEVRMAQFLEDAGNDEELAVRIYEWNADLCGAFMGVTHYVEVALRNAIDATLTAAYPDNPDPWFHNPAVLTEKGLEKVCEAVERLQREGKAVTRGRTIAALSHGFWDSLFNKRYAQLWQEHLRSAFPNGPRQRAKAAGVTSGVRVFRNRVAHHERLVHHPLDDHHNDLLVIVAWIDPGLRTWVAARSRVPALLAARPF